MEENLGKILIYQNEKGNTKIDVYFQEGNIGMTQKALADLYQVKIPTINEHIKNIIADGELKEEATIRNYLIVQNEGDRQVERETLHYSFEILEGAGHISAEMAKTIAQTECEKYDHHRKLMHADVNELLAETKRIEKGKKQS